MHISSGDQQNTVAASSFSRRSGERVLLVHNRVETGKRVFSCLEELGYDVEYAESSRRACDILNSHHRDFGVVLLDIGTATGEGYNLAETIRCSSDFRAISVATLSEDVAAAGRIYASAGLMPLYASTYPLNRDVLAVTMQDAISNTKRKRALERHVNGAAGSFNILESCRFSVSTLQDVEQSAYMAAACFPQPSRATHGLEELLLNAVEHGNLEIGHEHKFQLLKTGAWMDEIGIRLASEKYGMRKVDFAVVKREGGTSAVITDQGTGFDWQSVLNGTGASANSSHGRGISRARLMSFDKLAYNDAGNRVVAFMRDTGDLDW